LLVSVRKRVIAFVVLAVFSLLVLLIFKKFNFGFHFLGFSIFIGTMALFLFQNTKRKRTYNAFIISVFILNIIWTTYLFNMYLCNGWLYT
jgi:uncharacterized membrane protein